jgi:hypothetical protein
VEDDGESDEDARPRQRPHIEASETEQEEEASDEEAEMTGASSRADEQLAKKLIRYAIACEYSRTPIRRDGIKERGENAQTRETRSLTDSAVIVLGKQSRSFRRIFELAQTQLRAVWGVELRELPVREKMTLHEKRQGNFDAVV